MKELILIDSHALIHRAYHALPPLTTPDGKPIGAVYGLARATLKMLTERKPDYIAAAFDRRETTFRKEMFDAYKAQRPKAPDDLVAQFETSRELFSVLHIPVVDAAGFEADDIIGTLATRFASEEIHITILTGDLDSLQLVRDGFVTVATFKKGVSEMMEYNEAGVIARFGVEPSRVIDYKGLVGDTSDNIPGIPGIGPKTAEKLLSEFGTVESIFEKMEESHPLAKKVLAHKDVALFSKKLATIQKDVPLSVSLADLSYQPPEKSSLAEYFSSLGFQSFIKELAHTKEKKVETSAPQKKGDELIFSFEKDVDTSLLSTQKQKVAFSWKPKLKEHPEWIKEIQQPIFDISVAAWLLSPDENNQAPETVSRKFLQEEKSELSESDLRALFLKISALLQEERVDTIFTSFEMPLIPILAKMESEGIQIDPTTLRDLQVLINKETEECVKKIYALAGTAFNIGSPKQVGEVLFSKLSLEGKKKKTATGQIKTDKDTLEDLRDSHPIIPLILEYRENTKILNGFVEPLLLAADSSDRVHTTYLQTGTATGRLSSEKPNLQNIPQESKWAPLLRNAFVSKPGYSLVSFDYSQLELRLLAHECKDEILCRAFNEKKDIHTITASQVFKIPEGKITSRERRIGKTLNFGMVYGMGARLFARTSGIAVDEAKKFIEEYFRSFPKVKEWQEKIKQEAKISGYVQNENGRRRWFPQERFQELERAIINMPLQSLGADIMKKSLIESAEWVTSHNLLGEAVPLLTIHDELLFEIRDGIVNTTTSSLQSIMEKTFPLSVPLIVDVKIGKRWGEMK